MNIRALSKILIVEDEPINRELLKIYFREYYDLTFAHRIEDAFTYTDTIKFDLIITDIRLQGRSDDGMKLLHYIRKGSVNPRTRVIAYTSSGESSDQKSFFDEGFDGFIPKPVLRNEMLKRVKELLPGSE